MCNCHDLCLVKSFIYHLNMTVVVFPMQMTEKAVLLFRQYVKDSLYDRISTRPFLNHIEKKWITFQLLCALNQCHKLNVSINTKPMSQTQCKYKH